MYQLVCDAEINKYDGQNASATLSGSATVFGQTFNTGAVSLNVGTDTLTELPQLAANALAGPIKNYLNVAAQWVGWVKSGFMQGIAGATQLGQVLASQFQQTGDQIGQLAKNVMGYASADISVALNSAGQAAGAAAQILKNLGYGSSEVASVSAIGGALKSVYGDVKSSVLSILQDIGFSSSKRGPWSHLCSETA